MIRKESSKQKITSEEKTQQSIRLQDNTFETQDKQSGNFRVVLFDCEGRVKQYLEWGMKLSQISNNRVQLSDLSDKKTYICKI